MAQWQGQFSGRTHATKVREVESALTVAVRSLRAAPEDEVEKKLKAVKGIAKRLLSARLHMLKARISALAEKHDDSEVGTLRSRAKSTELDGVNGILREFGVDTDSVRAEQCVQAATRETRAP